MAKVGYIYNGDIDVKTLIFSREEAVFLADSIIAQHPDIADGEITVDAVYELLTEGQRAHIFNKLLKHGDYNVHGTSLGRLSVALEECMEAQS